MTSSESTRPIYLDYNATTPIDPRVVEAMQPYLTIHFGNPSSSHVFGRTARQAVERARQQVAELVGLEPAGILFTSGGTESNNLAIISGARQGRQEGGHIVTTTIEHPAVTAVLTHLQEEGFRVSSVPVDSFGRVDPKVVAEALKPETSLVTVMHANNEVGTVEPIAEIARVTRARGILLHCDCAQSAGKIPVRLEDLGADMISLAGHKLYAPKGVGALCLGPNVPLLPLLRGAGQEAGLRPGTENVPGIVGLGMACELAGAELAEERTRLAKLRDRLQSGLLAAIPEAMVHGHQELRLPNTLSIGFPGRQAAAILSGMPQIAVSAGAACHDGLTEVSSVLRAMGVPEHLARGTLRFSVGRMTTEDEIEQALPFIVQAAQAADRRRQD